jgi:hypothetical protein
VVVGGLDRYMAGATSHGVRVCDSRRLMKCSDL